MILKVQNLSKSFGGIKAADDVNFTVEQGRLIALIGPNGAGKSTLFNLLTGHIPKDSGKVIFKGEDISHLKPSEVCRKRIGRSFQQINFFQRMTVFENVQTAALAGRKMSFQFFRRASSMMREETASILEDMELTGQKDTIAADLSHGEQRRLDLAIALSNDPEILFLDEPCSGLTTEEINGMLVLLEKLVTKQKRTVLLVEHKMDVVFSIAEQVKVLCQGRIVFEGIPEEVRRSELVQKVYLGGQDAAAA